VAGSRLWRSNDRTGGLIDDILSSVRSRFPDTVVSRLVGTHAADDDNVFWVRRGGVEVQIDTASAGDPPYVVKSDGLGTRLNTDDADAVAACVKRLLNATES
jgi:uncharacterized iron-regulated membrane protein